MTEPGTAVLSSTGLAGAIRRISPTHRVLLAMVVGVLLGWLFPNTPGGTGWRLIKSPIVPLLSRTLVQFGLPLEGVGLILGVDAIMDMGRTSLNLLGNCLASVVMSRWEGSFGREPAALPQTTLPGRAAWRGAAAATTVVALLGVMACSGPGAGVGTDPPGTPDVAGSYTATTLTSTLNGTTEDQLAEGFTLSITLAPDGSTSGELRGPAGPGLPDVTMDLAGTWTQRGDTVRLQHDAEIFLKQMPFVVSGSELRGELTLGVLTRRVTLSR